MVGPLGAHLHDLLQPEPAPTDVAAQVVGVVALILNCIPGGPFQDDVLETRGKPLDLTLDGVGHVQLRTVGHMAITPRGVLPVWGTAVVELGLLCHQHKGPVRVLAIEDSPFGGFHLVI